MNNRYKQYYKVIDTMKNQKLFLIALLLVPWLTVPLLGRKAFKKFLPAALFMCTFTKGLDIFGENRRWWRVYEDIPYLKNANFFNFGPYLVSSLWVLKMTFGKFPLYLISNLILHICFIFLGGTRLLELFRIATIERLTKFQYLVINFIRALILYAFQYLTELSHTKKSFFNKK